MYQHILIPTVGSELAERAVTHGLSRAKFVGAKVTVIIVEERLGGWVAFAGAEA
jgi:nucleotide-binding universal stress UspA family protein